MVVRSRSGTVSRSTARARTPRATGGSLGAVRVAALAEEGRRSADVEFLPLAASFSFASRKRTSLRAARTRSARRLFVSRHAVRFRIRYRNKHLPFGGTVAIVSARCCSSADSGFAARRLIIRRCASFPSRRRVVGAHLMYAVEVDNLRKEFVRREKVVRVRRRVAARRRVVHDGARRVRRDPRPERLGQVDAGPAALDAAPARRRQRARVRRTTASSRRAPCAGSSTASRSRRASSRRCPPPRTSRTRRGSTGWGRRRRARAIPEILERVGFPAERRGEAMEHLSRGMQQKVALARALLTSPVLLLLDEPTTGLDPRSKLEVQEFIREMRALHDSTILLCTHDMAEAETLADRVGHPRPRPAALPRAGRGRQGSLRRRDARGGVLRRDRARLRGRDRGRRGQGGVRLMSRRCRARRPSGTS